jgi:hypothetical protein
MTGYIIILQTKAAVLDKTIEILTFKCYVQEKTCLQNMTGYIIISQKKTVILETTIEILHPNIINNNNKQLASTAICYFHVLETNIRQELLRFSF